MADNGVGVGKRGEREGRERGRRKVGGGCREGRVGIKIKKKKRYIYINI